MDWMGAKGFGGVMTCRKDPLPQDIPGKYLHKKKTDTSDSTKVACFFNPVVAVKNVEAVSETITDANLKDVETEVSKSYQYVHVSFHLTSLCNFSTVNVLNTCKASAMIRSRERGDNKKYWGVEMNEGWQFYLKTYGIIDAIDH
eukprot:15335858-Ditylum_brightwellii.AAC.1